MQVMFVAVAKFALAHHFAFPGLYFRDNKGQ
jgi:hypothetical protein